MLIHPFSLVFSMILFLPFNSPLSCPSCGNRADFSSGRRAPGYCLWSSRMLASSASERMVNNIHCYTPASWPFACPYFHPVEFLSCLHERLLSTSASCDDPYGCPAFRIKPFHLSTWQLHYGLAHIMRNKDPVHARCAGKFPTVASL